MLWIILIAIFAGLYSYFATQNTGVIDLRFGNYILSTIPIYVVILASILITASICGVVYLMRTLSSSLTIREKSDDLRDAKNEVAELTREVHKLELQNAKLKNDLGAPEDENSI